MVTSLKRLKSRLTPEKIRRKLRDKWHGFWDKTPFYKYIFASYWHGLLFGKISKDKADMSHFYITQRVYEGAGIGHQMTCWISGRYAALKTGMKYAHYPFANPEWEKVLGFYNNEKSIKQLKKEGYRIVRLKTFKIDDIDRETWRTIHSYSGKKVVFFVEGFNYQRQCDMESVLKDKFFNSPSRKDDRLVYGNDNYNIAVHIRRGDIVGKDGKVIAGLANRFQGLDYFYNATKSAISDAKTDKDIHVFIFSQGDKSEYVMFEDLNVAKIHYCMDMNQYDSFVHLVNADALITSKSSFSYNPALISRGKKYGAPGFWHDYPDRDDWKKMDEAGNIIEG